MENEVLIKNGIIMDGTGGPSFKADLLIQGDRIKDVGHFPQAKAATVIDADGLVIAPGFIDVHTHLDFFFPSRRHAEVLKSWAYQGVTTIVAGNCGFSPAPINPTQTNTLSTFWNFALPCDGLQYEWSSMGEYLNYLERNGLAFNAVLLTGHNTLRTNVMGFKARFANENEIQTMKTMLRESLKAGSFGLSLGLYYCPGIFSNTEEIMKLASVLRDFDAPLVPHVRGMSETFPEAVQEVIQVSEKNNIPLQISHLGCFLPDVSLLQRAKKAIKDGLGRGVRIGHDYIPMDVSSSTLLSIFPPWLFDGGMDKFMQRLGNPDIRQRVKKEFITIVPTWPTWEHNWWTDNQLKNTRYSWGLIHVGGLRNEKNRQFENMTIEEISRELKKDPYDTIFDLILEEQGRVIVSLMRSRDITSAIIDPNCSFATDIVGADFELRSNLVAYGTFTNILGNFARDKNVLTQEEAVRKMTSLPAKQMGIVDRGIIKKGFYADITIFDPCRINNRATFEDPHQLSEGVEYVLINGKTILKQGNYQVDAFAGKVLRRT